MHAAWILLLCMPRLHGIVKKKKKSSDALFEQGEL
jgi:hypothetical protein